MLSLIQLYCVCVWERERVGAKSDPTGWTVPDGVLAKQVGAKKWSERHVFLFDGLIILCKQNANSKRTSGAGPFAEYKLKEKHLIRKVDVVDREDTEGTFICLYARVVCEEEEILK